MSGQAVSLQARSLLRTSEQVPSLTFRVSRASGKEAFEIQISLIAVFFINQTCSYMTVFIMPINTAYEYVIWCIE